ncbi:MAG TPA: helical backbone metal receptor, partial [Acidimicrobiales bacterium]|nr:helical backbone metal receptor [Acidimicrobiales bacterium]
MRVVSLVPSVTETLRAWGVDPVGVTRFCEQPDLPAVGGTKNPDVARIAGLAPDLVVVDREENRREDAEALAAAGLRVHALHVTDLAGLDAQLDALADAVGVGRPGPTGAADGGVGAAAVGPGALAVWVPIWRRPWMAIGADTYATALLAAAGFAVVAAAPGRYPETTPAEAAAAGAAAVLAPSEPDPFAERHVAELSEVGPVALVDGRDLFWWGVRT